MTDDFGFSSRNSNFDELLKKYKPAEEVNPAGSVQSQPVQSGSEVSAAPVKRTTSKKAEKAHKAPKAEQPKPAEILPDAEVFEEELNSIFDNNDEPAFSVPEFEEEEKFSFDDSLITGEPAAEPAVSAEPVKEEPKFAYDLNMFGSSVPKAFDVDSYDNSWLDDSLDDSVFYNPEPAAQSQTASSYGAEISEETAPGEEYFDQPEEPKEPAFIPVNEPVKADFTEAAGGYVAPDTVEDFAFDEDSNLSFDDEEGDTSYGADYQTPQELEGLPVFTPAVPDKKSKKIKSKKEVNAVTGFSKDYNKTGSDESTPKKKKGFFKNNFVPSKDDPASEVLRKIIMIIAVLAIIGSGVYLFNDYVIMPYRNDKEVNELNGLLGDSNKVLDEMSIAEKYPGIDFPDGMLEKYVDLYARNQDFVGWVEIDGLDISLPVVQGVDNNQYLKTDFDGKTSKYGSIFMNSANSFDTLNYNTTLFGHHMKDQKMFGKLKEYKTVAGYKKAPLIEFNTLYGDYKWKIFAVFITNGTSSGDNGYLFNYMFTDLSTNEKVEEFLGEIKLRSIYYPEVDIAVSDKILTLSTCTYELDEGRLIIMARMVRPGESDYVNVDAVRYNSNPRYPQGYYEKNGKSNPYTDYPKWYPS